MVREDQVGAAAGHVVAGAQVVEGDRGALDVPAGAAPAQRGVPGGLPRPLGAPQQPVERVALAGPLGVAAALGEQGGHLRLVVAGHLAELGGVGHAEVDVAVEVVGDALGAQLGDQVRHPADDLGDADVFARRQDAQRLHVAAEQLDLALGQFLPVDAGLLRPFQQRIVHVRGVLRVVHLVAGITPDAADEVEGVVGVGVAEVGGVVGGDAADVHPGGGTGIGLPHLLGGGVVETQRNALTWELWNVLGRPRSHAFEPIRPDRRSGR